MHTHNIIYMIIVNFKTFLFPNLHVKLALHILASEFSLSIAYTNLTATKLKPGQEHIWNSKMPIKTSTHTSTLAHPSS